MMIPDTVLNVNKENMELNVNTAVISVKTDFVICINVLKGVNPDTMRTRQTMIMFVIIAHLTVKHASMERFVAYVMTAFICTNFIKTTTCL